MRPRRRTPHHDQPAWALLGLTRRSTTGVLAHALHDHGLGSIPAFTREQLLLRLHHPPTDDFAVVVLDSRLLDAEDTRQDETVGAIRDRSDAAIVALADEPLPAADVTLPLEAPPEAIAASASIVALRPSDTGPAARWGPFYIDRPTWEAYWHETPLRLTTQQFRLLTLLVEAQGAAVGVQQLAQTLYGHALDGDSDPIRAHVGRLRRRLLAVAPEAIHLLRTVRGQGYRLDRPINDSAVHH